MSIKAYLRLHNRLPNNKVYHFTLGTFCSDLQTCPVTFASSIYIIVCTRNMLRPHVQMRSYLGMRLVKAICAAISAKTARRCRIYMIKCLNIEYSRLF